MDNLAFCSISRRVTLELLEIKAAEDRGSQGSSTIFQMTMIWMTWRSCYFKMRKEYDVDLNFEDISEDDFPSPLR